MSSDHKEPRAFFSYAHSDDLNSGGQLTTIHDLLQRAARLVDGSDFEIFVDTKGIDWGEKWNATLMAVLGRVPVLIPVFSAAYFNSEWCRKELSYFLECEDKKRILPILLRDFNSQSLRCESAERLWERAQELQWERRDVLLQRKDERWDMTPELEALGDRIVELSRSTALPLSPTKFGSPEILRKKADPPWAIATGEDEIGRWAEFEVHDIRQRLRWCPPGAFVMGSPEDETGRSSDEGPQRTVRFAKGFWMFDTAVRRSLWRAVMDHSSGEAESREHPVSQVSWFDAGLFCDRLGSLVQELVPRLPSEAEWEYACRAGTQTPYWWGNVFDSEISNEGEAMAVRSFPANQWGLFEISGNIWEWCEDEWRKNYNNAPLDGSARYAKGSLDRVVRGGCFDKYLKARSACKLRIAALHRHRAIGLRCAVSCDFAG